jgi:hypothetical protein
MAARASLADVARPRNRRLPGIAAARSPGRARAYELGALSANELASWAVTLRHSLR